MVLVQKNIGWFQISVNHTRRVRITDRLRNHCDHRCCFADTQLPGGKKVLERYALNKLADDKQYLLVPSNFEHGDNVRMVQLSGGARFAKELLRTLTAQFLEMRDFNGNKAV